MPITSHEHLKQIPNRCRLVVIADTARLEENDCYETLRYYGSIKNIQLTHERNAAFVDFECEHAPLLVARCFKYYKTPLYARLYAENEKRREKPLPRGTSAVLPGCSFGNYIYLQHVPRALSTRDLYNHFFRYGNSNRILIYRPGPDDNPATRAVVKINGTPAERYHRNQFLCSEVKSRYNTYTFHAIPHLPVLTNARNLFETADCDECNTSAFARMADYVDLATKRDASPAADREVMRPVIIHFNEVAPGPPKTISFPWCDEERWDDVPIPPPPIPWRVAVMEQRPGFFGKQESSNSFFSSSAVFTGAFSRSEQRSNVVPTRSSQESVSESARENRADEKREEERQAIDELPRSSEGKEEEKKEEIEEDGEQRVPALPTPDCFDAATSVSEDGSSEVEQRESARAISEDGREEEKRDEADQLEEEKEQRSAAPRPSSPPTRALSADSLATAIEKEAEDAAADDDPAVLMMTMENGKMREEKEDEEMEGEEGEEEEEEAIDLPPSPTTSLAASDTVSSGASPSASLEGTVSPTPSPPPLSLHHEDTESCREESDEDELATARGYGSPSEESSILSDADTVVGDGFYEDPDLWDETDRIAYGYKKKEAMERIEEEETLPTTSLEALPAVSVDLPPFPPIPEEETRVEEPAPPAPITAETTALPPLPAIPEEETRDEEKEEQEPAPPAPLSSTVSFDVQLVENNDRSDVVPEPVPCETLQEEKQKDCGSQVPLKPKRKQEPVSKLNWRNWHDPQLQPVAVPQFLPRRPLPAPPSYFSRGFRPSPPPAPPDIVVPKVVVPTVSSPKPTVSYPRPTVSAAANPLSLSYREERCDDVPEQSPPKPLKSAEKGSQDIVNPQSPSIQLKTSEKEIAESGSQGAVPALQEKEKGEATRETQAGCSEKKRDDTVSSPSTVLASSSRQDPLVPRRQTIEGDEIWLEPIEEEDEVEEEKEDAAAAKAVGGREDRVILHPAVGSVADERGKKEVEKKKEEKEAEQRDSLVVDEPVMVAEASALVFPTFGRRVEVETRATAVPVEKGVSFGCFRRNEEAIQRGPIHPGTNAVLRKEEKITVDQDEEKSTGHGVVPEEKGVSFGCFRRSEEANQRGAIHPGTNAVIRVGEKTTVDQNEVKATVDGVVREEQGPAHPSTNAPIRVVEKTTIEDAKEEKITMDTVPVEEENVHRPVPERVSESPPKCRRNAFGRPIPTFAKPTVPKATVPRPLVVPERTGLPTFGSAVRRST